MFILKGEIQSRYWDKWCKFLTECYLKPCLWI